MDLGLKVNVKPIELDDRSTQFDRIPTTEIRRSPIASSIDGVFAAIYSNLTSEVLLGNFLVNLQANSLYNSLTSAANLALLIP